MLQYMTDRMSSLIKLAYLPLPFHVLRVPGFGDCCSNWASCHSVISAIPGAGLVQHRPSDNIKKDVLESEWNEFQGTLVGDQGHGSMGKWGWDSDGKNENRWQHSAGRLH